MRGGYHFARPASSTGAVQAAFFVAHGGGWSGDGITLPGMLDLEDGCAGKSAADMVAWIASFVNKYKALTGRYPMIYTTTSWWTSCTGNSKLFAADCPLVLARYASAPGTLPGAWPFYTIWQYNDAYVLRLECGDIDADCDDLVDTSTAATRTRLTVRTRSSSKSLLVRLVNGLWILP